MTILSDGDTKRASEIPVDETYDQRLPISEA